MRAKSVNVFTTGSAFIKQPTFCGPNKGEEGVLNSKYLSPWNKFDVSVCHNLHAIKRYRILEFMALFYLFTVIAKG